ncbi:pheromone processing endoprotease, partial [Cladochytrium tenue]
MASARSAACGSTSWRCQTRSKNPGPLRWLTAVVVVSVVATADHALGLSSTTSLAHARQLWAVQVSGHDGQLDGNALAGSIANALGLVHVGPLAGTPGFHVLAQPHQDLRRHRQHQHPYDEGDAEADTIGERAEAGSPAMLDDAAVADALRALPGVKRVLPQPILRRVHRAAIPHAVAAQSPSKPGHLNVHSLSESAAAAATDSSVQAAANTAPRAVPPHYNDPQFRRQWHLFNDGANGLHAGNDVDVADVWLRGINGSGVTVAIVDDGVDFDHPDFSIGSL